MLTQQEIIYGSLKELKNLDICIDNIKLNQLTLSKSIKLLSKYNLLKNDFIVLPKGLKVVIKLFNNEKMYSFYNNYLLANLYFEKTIYNYKKN